MPPSRMQISVPDADLEALRIRLSSVRWPVHVREYGWEDGTDGQYLREVVSYWRDQYDWRSREALMNELDHFTVEIDGEVLHYIHCSGRGKRRIPLMMLYGWPSSFVQMLDIIPLLTQAGMPDDLSFDVVVAALPGYPFTRLPTRPGMSFARMAELMVRLMVSELGYEQFAVRGTDQGGLVLQQIGLHHPKRLIGLHRSGITPFANPMPDNLTPEEEAYQKQVQAWAARETDYVRLQASRPETLVPALTDSPVGLASWFLEKFQRWGDCRNGIDETFGRDRLIDNLSLHWFTRSAASVTRLYREAARNPSPGGRVEVPTAIMMPLHDGVTVPAPQSWCNRSYNVQWWTVMEKGGHFPEWEVPELVARDIRSFFNSLTLQTSARSREPVSNVATQVSG